MAIAFAETMPFRRDDMRAFQIAREANVNLRMSKGVTLRTPFVTKKLRMMPLD